MTGDIRDIERVCPVCGISFTLPAQEVKFYAEKYGIENVPKRCRDCRSTARKTSDKGILVKEIDGVISSGELTPEKEKSIIEKIKKLTGENIKND